MGMYTSYLVTWTKKSRLWFAVKRGLYHFQSYATLSCDSASCNEGEQIS